MQPVDFTTLKAVCHELRSQWLPARCEQVVQRDRHTICLALRTFEKRGWLTLSWHPQAARIHIGDAPPRQPDTFTFSQQLKHQINGLALTSLEFLSPWERALDLQFAPRPGDAPRWHIYVEIMGKYSNVLLTNAQQEIITAAHQVSVKQSSVRPISTGDRYQHPPAIVGTLPKPTESFESWQSRVSLVPGKLRKMVLKAYSGVSSALIRQLVGAANLDPDQLTPSLTPTDWHHLYDQWQRWLTQLDTEAFQPGRLESGGYTVLGLGKFEPTPDVQSLLDRYYRDQLNQQVFAQLHHQLSQKLKARLTKLNQKAETFKERLTQSDQANDARTQADLLMAHLHQWRPGLSSLELADFETGEPVEIALNPEKNAVQNAQTLYKRHQKLKRTRDAIMPLLEAVNAEIRYLEQVEAALLQLTDYIQPADLDALQDVREELIQQGYMSDPYQQPKAKLIPNFHRLTTPDGRELIVGRNNNQNDYLTFKVATDYDLWLHTQEIPGSHVLLRLNAGEVASDADLAFAADVAAYFSRARQSDQVPVVYTQPKHVYKPKGERPGMVIYKHEQILWGQPQRAKARLETAEASQDTKALAAL
ncbi:MAG: NFACT RNA binding domain-containing protein [Cyanobacteria bacterium P01_D01_bin.44]